MTKIAWVTDSMAYFTKEEAEAIGVNVVPIQILLGDTAYQENAITVERLFRALDADKKLIAKTSQPIFGEFVGTYERLKEEGIDARPSELSPYGVVADKGFMAGSSLYKEGFLTIPD